MRISVPNIKFIGGHIRRCPATEPRGLGAWEPLTMVLLAGTLWPSRRSLVMGLLSGTVSDSRSLLGWSHERQPRTARHPRRYSPRSARRGPQRDPDVPHHSALPDHARTGRASRVR